jgi:hypothetical protein
MRAHRTHFGAIGPSIVRLLLVVHAFVVVLLEAIFVFMVLAWKLLVPITLLWLILIMIWFRMSFSLGAHSIRGGSAHVHVMALAIQNCVVLARDVVLLLLVAASVIVLGIGVFIHWSIVLTRV